MGDDQLRAEPQGCSSASQVEAVCRASMKVGEIARIKKPTTRRQTEGAAKGSGGLVCPRMVGENRSAWSMPLGLRKQPDKQGSRVLHQLEAIVGKQSLWHPKMRAGSKCIQAQKNMGTNPINAALRSYGSLGCNRLGSVPPAARRWRSVYNPRSPCSPRSATR